MKDKKINTNKLMIRKLVYIFVFFLFIIFAITLSYRCLIDYKAKGNLTISEFIKNRNIVEETILPERGSIYDKKGNVLAQDVSSYTLIAYLDEKRTTNKEKPRHVVDKEKTAKILSEQIDEKYERILEILKKDAYQVEFGLAGKNLSQIEMENIKNLNLPGIDFIKSNKRYYPNGDFASYLLGYTKNKEDENGNIWMNGELGIEGYYNKELTGTEGYITYEQDGRGNVISNSNEYIEEAVNGSDVYLTIDNSIQLFIENATKKASEDSKGEWVVMAVMNAKTGEILGYSSTPSYDPNIRNLTNYMDPLVSYAYEPGSTMKTFSYMCAIESGKYHGEDTFESGSKTYTSAINEKDQVTIKDWNGTGWGKITYDHGFAMSSNIGVANLLESVITKQELKACYNKYGFGSKTNITLGNELTGNIDFTYDVEAATAGYGQGINVTPIQMLQALSIVSNNGNMLKPYIVDKIITAEGETKQIGKQEVTKNVVSSETIEKIKQLMRSVVCNDSTVCTGSAYYMEGYDLIGKTGTASIYENGRYNDWGSNYIYSFAGIYPGDNPEIIAYMAIKKPKDTNNYIAPAIKEVVKNVSNYLNISNSNKQDTGYTIKNYQNKTTTEVVKELTNNNLRVITLGTGNKIVKQYPEPQINVYKNDLVVLLTNNYDNKMIDLKGLSYKEVKNVLNLMNVKYTITGNGYVDTQSIAPGEPIDKELNINLKKLY